MLLNTVLNSATARQFMQLSEDFAFLWLASGQDFQNTPRPAVPCFLYIEPICAQYHFNRVLPCPRSPRSS